MSANITRKLIKLDTHAASDQDGKNLKIMRSEVVGQDDAVNSALDAIAYMRNPLRDTTRPYVLFEIGESRSGKTLIAETIALILHGSKERMLKVNCGDYMERGEGWRLIGSPIGYYGSDVQEGAGAEKRDTSKGTTTAKLAQANLDASRGDSQCPITVVLLDEVDLLHQSLDNYLMSIMDKGELDLGNNTKSDFRNCIIVMTSNIGMTEVYRRAEHKSIGFRQEEKQEVTKDDIRTIVGESLKGRYRREWLNRIDKFVIFAPHTDDTLLQIVDLELDKFRRRMDSQLGRGQIFQLEVEVSAKKFLLAAAAEDKNNLAQFKRAFREFVEMPLGKLLDAHMLGNGDVVVISHEDGEKELTFSLAVGENVASDADRMIGVNDTAATRGGLARQRQIDRAQKSSAPKHVFAVAATCTTQERMIAKGAELMHDINEVLKCKLESHKYSSHGPWVVTLEVIANEEQMAALQNLYPKVTITRLQAVAEPAAR